MAVWRGPQSAPCASWSGSCIGLWRFPAISPDTTTMVRVEHAQDQVGCYPEGADPLLAHRAHQEMVDPVPRAPGSCWQQWRLVTAPAQCVRARGAVATRSFVTQLHRCPLVTSNPSTARGSVLPIAALHTQTPDTAAQAASAQHRQHLARTAAILRICTSAWPELPHAQRQ